MVTTDKQCPNCHNVVPMLATVCVHCNTPLGGGAAAEEAPRFHVVRKNQAPEEPASPDAIPPEVRHLTETDQVWYCRIGGQTVGPVTADDIRDAYSKGQIDSQASVGVRGRKAWFPIKSLPQFSGLVTGVGPSPSRPPNAQLPALFPTPSGASTRPVAGMGAPLPSPTNAPEPRPGPLPTPTPAGPLPPGPGVSGPPLDHNSPPGGASTRPVAGMGGPLPSPVHMPGPRPAPLPPPPSAGPLPKRPGMNGPLPDHDSPVARYAEDTELVPPMPVSDQHAMSSTGRLHDPSLEVWQAEVQRFKRLALIFGLIAAVLLLTTATLLGLLVNR